MKSLSSEQQKKFKQVFKRTDAEILAEMERKQVPEDSEDEAIEKEYAKRKKARLEYNLKKELKKDKKAEEAKQLEEERNNQLLASTGKLTWNRKSSNFDLEGSLDDKKLFEIKKGILVYSLYVTESFSKNIKTGYIGCSTNLIELKKMAEKILNENEE